MDRASGELLVAEKYDPVVNWATHVDMKTGRPQVVDRYSTAHQGEDVNTTTSAQTLGSKDQQPLLTIDYWFIHGSNKPLVWTMSHSR